MNRYDVASNRRYEEIAVVRGDEGVWCLCDRYRTFYKFLFSLSFLFFSVYVNSTIQAFVEPISPPFDEERVLPDVGFFVFENWEVKDGGGIVDALSAALSVSVLLGFWYASGRIFNEPISRFFLIQAWIFALRAVSISMTILPKPSSCTSTANEYHPLVEGVLISFGIHRTCSDVLFSGHAANMTLSALGWIHYVEFPFRRGTLRWTFATLYVAATAFSLIFVIVSRFHYTVDVFYGFLVSVVLFYSFERRWPLDLTENVTTSSKKEGLFVRRTTSLY